MTAQKHTPRPWFIHPDVDHPYEIQIAAGPLDDEGCPEVWVAECFGGLSDGEREANARLIAAAPEMLDALLEAKSEMRDWSLDHPAMRQIDAAIAKATGQ